MVTLRKADLNDIELLQFIGSKTFQETFENLNSKEDMERYLKNSFNLEQLKTELTNPNSMFYFAESKTEIIGYLKMNWSTAQTEIKKDKSLEIERIYVLKEYQKNRVGQLLFENALEIAKKKKYEYVWLGVWEENRKAINFYKKNGFTAFDKHIFKLGNDEQTDIMMKLELK